MENATDALIMAGSVLLLIIALTITISSLSNLRMEAQNLLMERDQILITKDSLGDYLNYIKNDDNDVRIVGIETLISAIRRMWKEDYTIYIVTNQSYSNLQKFETTINYSDYLSIQGKPVYKFNQEHENNLLIRDNDILKNVYYNLKGAKFKEYIGIYQEKTDPGVSEANKPTYKIITFVQE